MTLEEQEGVRGQDFGGLGAATQIHPLQLSDVLREMHNCWISSLGNMPEMTLQNTEACPKTKLLELVLSTQGFTKTSPSTKTPLGMGACSPCSIPAQAAPSPLPGAGTWEQNTTLGDSIPKVQGEKSPPSFETGQEETQTAKLPLRTWGDQPFCFRCYFHQGSSSVETSAGHSLHQPQYFHCKPFFHYFKKSAVKIHSRLDLGNQRLCLGETYFTCTTPLSYWQFGLEHQIPLKVGQFKDHVCILKSEKKKEQPADN